MDATCILQIVFVSLQNVDIIATVATDIIGVVTEGAKSILQMKEIKVTLLICVDFSKFLYFLVLTLWNIRLQS